MQIKLLPKGPPMWFLGEPKKLKVSLTCQQPGPVEIDFRVLTSTEQRQILLSMRNQQIEASESFEDLHAIYLTQKQVEEPPPEVKQYLEKKAEEEEQETFLAAQVKAEQKTKKITERCEYLATLSYRAIKAALLKEKDPKVFRIFLEIEKKGRARLGVIQFVEERLKRIHMILEKSIEASEKEPAIRLPKPADETYLEDVVESEVETLVLTEQDLIDLASGKSLGG